MLRAGPENRLSRGGIKKRSRCARFSALALLWAFCAYTPRLKDPAATSICWAGGGNSGAQGARTPRIKQASNAPTECMRTPRRRGAQTAKMNRIPEASSILSTTCSQKDWTTSIRSIQSVRISSVATCPRPRVAALHPAAVLDPTPDASCFRRAFRNAAASAVRLLQRLHGKRRVECSDAPIRFLIGVSISERRLPIGT